MAGLAACAKYNPSSNASHARHRMVGVGEKNQQICCIKTDVILEQKVRDVYFANFIYLNECRQVNGFQLEKLLHS